MAKSLDHSVLFVCFGNICRSPIAEIVFKKMLDEKSMSKSWVVDSAATGSWYIGKPPDPRALEVLKSRQYGEIDRKSRQVEDADFFNFEYMLAMDDANMKDLGRMAPKGAKAKRELLGSYDPTGVPFIDDPYFTKGNKSFYKILDLCTSACDGFLKKILTDDNYDSKINQR